MTVQRRQLAVVILMFVVLGTLSFILPWAWWQLALVGVVPFALLMWWASKARATDASTDQHEAAWPRAQ